MRTINRARRVLATLVVATTTVAAVAAGSPAEADHEDGGPWIVTLGDSAISGEAGRWAGNTNDSYTRVDAGGWDAYYDNATGTAEQIPGCHRSESAEVHIGVNGVNAVNSLNLACSGARTSTQTGGDFKPGIDFYDDGAGGQGQATMLQEFAADHDVDAVVLLIGANNYGFADIVTQCVLNWMTSPWWWKNYCNDDSSIRSRFTTSAIAARTAEVKGAIDNVVSALDAAGQAQDTYTLIVQTYWSPVPRGADIRYSERGWTRQSVGGCGMWNRDADWANDVAVVAMNRSLTDAAATARLQHPSLDVEVLDMQRALHGHRLCEQGVGLLEEVGVADWTVLPAAPDRTEWVSQIRTTTTIFGPYQLQEDIHSSYWGQLAMRNCLRQAYGNGGEAVSGGTCTPAAGGGVNGYGEPNMTLTP